MLLIFIDFFTVDSIFNSIIPPCKAVKQEIEKNSLTIRILLRTVRLYRPGCLFM